MTAGLRELKKQRTRSAIQKAALELIDRQGYDATTCAQIAAAAEVSAATFFRYFPTKEDVVLTDDYDPMITYAVTTRPPGESPLQAARRGLAHVLGDLDDDAMATVRARTALLLSVPALRSRLQEQMSSTRFAFATAFAPRLGKDPAQMEVQVLAAACAAALSVAIEAWASSQRELTRIVDEALAALEAF
jgi:AcrR family transcriptional regulator